MDDRTHDRLVREGAEQAVDRLLAVLGDDVDPAKPSRLPGWTVGHVLTHVARNADSMTRVFTGGGEPVERYVGGGVGRDEAISIGAGRPLGELRVDVADSADRLHTSWAAFPHWATARSIEGPDRTIPVTDLPMMRWREVEVHTVDLGIGVEPADWPSLFVRLELRTMEMRWRARRPMGLTGLPAEALVLDPPTRLAWLYGRTEIEGLPPAQLM